MAEQDPDAAGVTRRSTPVRIVVTGSESTGKTTLARDLASRLGAPWVPEYARAYAEGHGAPLTASDVEPIARGQMRLEDEALAAQPEPRLLIFDTDLVSTVVYARHYYDACPPWILSAARARMGALYLLADIHVPWFADGVRDRPQARAEIQTRFAEALRELGAPVLEVRGAHAERLATALSAARRLLRGG